MRTDLTRQQEEILNSDLKEVSWLFEVDMDGDGTPEYRWTNQDAKVYGGNTYSWKIISFTPPVLSLPDTVVGTFPPVKTKIQVSFPDSILDGVYTSSDFKDVTITVRLVCSADLGLRFAPGTEFADTDDTNFAPDVQEAQILAWKFKVVSAFSIDQILYLECQDFFTLQLEGDYPKKRSVSDLWPAKVMKSDTAIPPLVFGTPYIPLRLVFHWQDVTYVASNKFMVEGDQTDLFANGQYLWASCGNDGKKDCWVAHSYFSDIDSSADIDSSLAMDSSANWGYTIVTLTDASDDLTSNLTKVATDHYILGDSAPTYTVDRSRVPKEMNFSSEYLSTDYTFKQDIIEGSDGNNYKALQLIVADYDKDGTNDSNGIWNVPGKEFYDVPVRFSRSDTVNITNPPNIAEYIFEDWGIDSDDIDDTSKDVAVAVFAVRGIEFHAGFWYQQKRRRIISKLFSISGMVPVYRGTIGFKVLTKTSQFELEEAMVKPGSFRIVSGTFTQDQKDSGYVIWQESTEPVDQVNKSLIAAKSSTSNPSTLTIETEWIQDSVKAQKAGKLALQRSILKNRTISFIAQGKILILEPGDMITVNPQNFGAEAGPYDALIIEMSMTEGLWVTVKCITFREDLDDWDDLSESSITIGEVNEARGYSPVVQGPNSTDTAGTQTNEVVSNIQVGTDGQIKTNADPTTNGGFLITNTYAAGYNTSGSQRFRVDYGGVNQGDVEIGDYDNDKGAKWDQSAGTFMIRGGLITSSGSVKRFELSNIDHEAHFYGDRGDSTIEEMCTIGIKGAGADYSVISAGSYNLGSTRTGVYGQSYSRYGVWGNSYDNYGIYGTSATDYGGYFRGTTAYGVFASGAKGTIVLDPSSNASAPTHSAVKGTLWVTSAGVLYINTNGSTTWAKVGGQ